MGRVIIILLLFTLTSCQKKSRLTFMLLNESSDNSEITLDIKVGDISVFDNKLSYGDGHSLIIEKDIPTGKYTLFVNVKSDSLTKSHPLMVDKDRLIYINYKFNATDTIQETVFHNGDSVTILRLADKRDAKLDITVTDNDGP